MRVRGCCSGSLHTGLSTPDYLQESEARGSGEGPSSPPGGWGRAWLGAASLPSRPPCPVAFSRAPTSHDCVGTQSLVRATLV